MAIVALVDNFSMEKLDVSYEAKGFCHAYYLKEKNQISKIAQAFKEEGYFLETITAFDKGDGLKMLYIFNVHHKVHRTVVYFDVAYNDEVETITSVYPSADWFESEVYDMFGVTFKGHPNLKRLLTPEGMKGFPLLKSWNPEEE
ncbi:MAG: hypothetical protein OHK0040_14070 [bacterium]